MKRYWAVLRDEYNITGEHRVYLASDVDRLRADAREKVAKYVHSGFWGLGTEACAECYATADQILSVIFDEVQT